jgi:hypothetical protein
MKKFIPLFMISIFMGLSGIGYSDKRCVDNCSNIYRDYLNNLSHIKNECNQRSGECKKKCKPGDKKCIDLCSNMQRSCDTYWQQKIMINNSNSTKCRGHCNEGDKSKCAGDCSSKGNICQMNAINGQKSCIAAYNSCQNNCSKLTGAQEASCRNSCINNHSQCDSNDVKKYNCDANYNACKSKCK